MRDPDAQTNGRPDAPIGPVVERLKRRGDFRAAARGSRVSAGPFVVQARARDDGGAVRVGFTVSKQVGSAVERNRVRRRLREIVRRSLADAPGAATWRPGHDYVLVGRREALRAPFGAMMQELDAALDRIHARANGGTGGGARRSLHEPGQAVPPSGPKPPRRRKRRVGPPVGRSEEKSA